jgi:DNA repair protein RadC
MDFVDAGVHSSKAPPGCLPPISKRACLSPRELVKRGLELHAHSGILARNDPWVRLKPSGTDEFITQSLKIAFLLVDVQVLDHVVVGSSVVFSFAKRGLLREKSS